MASIHLNRVHLTYRIPKIGSLSPIGEEVMEGIGNVVVGKRRYHLIKALNDITFDLRSGDRLAITGPEYAGKRSLIKVLRGIHTPTKGHVKIEGTVDSLLLNDIKLDPDMTGRRNVELCAVINGWNKEDIQARMDDIIHVSGVGNFIDVPVRFLKIKMRQQLIFSIVIHLAKVPGIFLINRWPFGAGKNPFREKISEKINSILEQAEIVVLISNDKKLIKEKCNKVLALDCGRQIAFQDLSTLVSEEFALVSEESTPENLLLKDLNNHR